jgi:F0F1-type ATP synthase assembly protein I
MVKPDPDRLRKWAELTGIGPLLAASVLVGYLAGSGLDALLGSAPWGMTGGVVLGAVGGFIEVVRLLKRLGEGPGGRPRTRRARAADAAAEEKARDAAARGDGTDGGSGTP